MAKRSRESSNSPPSSPTKAAHLDPHLTASNPPSVMKCFLPPHEPLSFSSFDDYHVHYQKIHVNRCTECDANFPDDHFLHLHIAENHDPITEARKARGEKTYACFVPACDRVCSAPAKRRLHCIDKHQFPRFYDFFIVNEGIDRRNSMLRRRARKSSTATSTSSGGADAGLSSPRSGRHGMKAANTAPLEPHTVANRPETVPEDGPSAGQGQQDRTRPQQSAQDAVDVITAGMSSLSFVPSSLRFGRRRGRGGFGKA